MGLIFRLKFLAGPHIMQSPVLGRLSLGSAKAVHIERRGIADAGVAVWAMITAELKAPLA